MNFPTHSKRGNNPTHKCSLTIAPQHSRNKAKNRINIQFHDNFKLQNHSKHSIEKTEKNFRA